MDKSSDTVFAAIKQGVMSLQEFQQYLEDIREKAWDDGYSEGDRTGYECGVIDARRERE